MDRSILHVDMDAFYASVEQRDDPRLRGRPLIVGGHKSRGVVLAASYEVRPFGVRSAMPMALALHRCPGAVVVPPRFSAYAAASEEIFAIFLRYTPLVEPLSLDEAFLDVGASRSLFGSGLAIATALRRDIANELSLPASAGVAASKFVAKIASDLAKPDGVLEVPAKETCDFLAPLQVSRLFGVGPRAESALHTFGLRTIGDVARADAALLDQLGALGRHLRKLSLGIDDRPVIPDQRAKSIGAEDTFAEDLDDLAALRAHVLGQALRVGTRLRRAGVQARAVQVKLKRADFTVITRRTTLPSPTDDGQALYRAAVALLAEALGAGPRATARLRLTGVAAQDLQVGQGQLGLFDGEASKRRRLNSALDAIESRFGGQAVRPADLSGRPRR